MQQIDRTRKLNIKTPEGIVFSLTLAGPLARALAWFVDIGSIIVLTAFTGKLLTVFKVVSIDLSGALFAIANFVISIGYAIVLEWRWRGQTLGKKLLRLRVMDAQGLRLRFSQIVIRNIMRFVDSLPILYAAGGITCFLNRRGQRIGDITANTMVVRSPELSEPDIKQLTTGKFNSLRAYPHLCARLRQAVTPQEAAIAVKALLRRDELHPGDRVELFAFVADHFKRITPFPEDAVYGIGDEQYLRNVVDILFSAKL